MKSLYYLSLMAMAARAAVPGVYTGAQSCQGCHPDQFATQRTSAHAAALARVSDHPNLIPQGTLLREPRYRYQILRTESGLGVHIEDGADRMDLPLEWAFGAGRQATTLVTRVNQEYYIEHYASWYRATQAWGPTPGQEPLHPKAMSEAAGVLYKIADPQFGIQGCFECHTTGPVSFNSKGDAIIREVGVQCEGCHGPGGEHAADPRHHRVANPGMLSTTQLNDFCGRCHRPPAAKGVIIDWSYAWNVRHQPVYLSESRCFRESGTLSCLTCHGPHEAAENKPIAFFNGKCLGCHAGSGKSTKTGCLAKGRTNCIDCHMPRVSPQPPLHFTNHWIGIYRSGARLKPEGR